LTWAIGDIQGCYDYLNKLLKEINFNPNKDTLLLAGDLVNRGNKSLETLEFLYDIKNSVKAVLGNHDMRLIYAFYGLKNSNETLEPILRAKNAKRLINWLKRHPFMYENQKFILVHAGISPIFTLNMAREYNKLLSRKLNGFGAKEWLERLQNINEPKFKGNYRLKDDAYALFSFVNMRYCKKNGELDFKQKGAPKDIKDKNLFPWFKCPVRKNLAKKVIFGHWSTLGLYEDNNVICLDSGCIWSRSLSAYNLESGEIVKIDCKCLQPT